jgi:uncharacterized membrane protein
MEVPMGWTFVQHFNNEHQKPVKINALHILLGILLFSIAVGCLAHSAAADLRLCNNTKMPLETAVGYYNEGAWYTDGWWDVWPNDCSTVITGKLSQRNYYLYAESFGKFFRWGGDAEFCVIPEQMTRLSNDACEKTEKFYKVDIGDKVVDEYTSRLSCPDCQLPKFRYNKQKQSVTGYHVLNFDEYGQNITIPVESYSAISLEDGDKQLTATTTLYVDLSNIQSKIEAIAQNFLSSSDDCGDNLAVRKASLAVSGRSAEMQVEARYSRWLCTYADLPQITCEDTWITAPGLKTKGVPSCGTYCEDTWIITDLPFGGEFKTKGLPTCEVRCEDTWIETPGLKTKGVPKCTNHGIKTVRTSHNKILQQSGGLTVSIEPSVVGNQISLNPSVTSVQLEGFAQVFVDLLNIDLKQIAQSLLDSAIDPGELTLAIPPDMRDFTTLEDAKFVDEDGELWLSVAGKFEITGSDALTLCKRFWPEGKCEAVH